MKFFAGLSKPAEFSVEGVNTKRTKEGEVLIANMELRVELNGNTVRSTPIFIRDEYDTFKKSTSRTKDARMDTTIDDQSVEFFSTPESPEPHLLIPYTTVEKMVIKKDKEGKVFLYFTITKIEIDDSNLRDIIHSNGRTLFAKFTETAPRLIESENEEEEEATAPATKGKKSGKKGKKYVN